MCACCFGALASGCTTDGTTSNVSLATSTATGPTIAFDSIDGPPVGVFNRLVDNLSAEAQVAQSRDRLARGRRELSRARLSGGAGHPRPHAYFLGVGRLRRRRKLRALRITGEEAGGRAGGDPWSVADEAMLRKIARTSMDRLAALPEQSRRAAGRRNRRSP